MNLSQVLIKKIRPRLEKKVKKAVPDVVGLIANRQGKFSGQLRASNNVGLGSADLSKVEVVNYVADAISGTTLIARSNAKAVIQAFKLGQNVVISNNHDYAIYDEFKHGRLAYEGGKDAAKSILDRS